MQKMTGSLVAALALCSGTASAVVPASQGKAWHGNDEPCLRRDYGQVSNKYCPGKTVLYTIGEGAPACYDVRNHTAYATFSFVGTYPTKCNGLMLDRSGWPTHWTGLLNSYYTYDWVRKTINLSYNVDYWDYTGIYECELPYNAGPITAFSFDVC